MHHDDDDDRAIRRLIDRWHAATAAGDVEAVLELMSDDAVFLIPGQAPMRGRDAFAQRLRDVLKTHRIESDSDIRELVISGELAYCWSMLSVRMRALDGELTQEREGSVLTILRKHGERWQLIRDANLLVRAER